MSGEVKYVGPGPGAQSYFQVRGSGNSIWSTSGGVGGFEVFQAADWEQYAIDAVEQSTSNVYVGDFPSNAPPGVYDLVALQMIDVTAAITDPQVAAGELQWNGTKRLPLSDTATSGQVSLGLPIRLARAQMVQNFPVYLKSSADHVTPFTSGVVSGQIARDGGSFGVLQSGAFTETGLGYYNLQALTSGDLNAATVKLVFTATGVSGGVSDPLALAFVLQTTSG